MFASLLIIAFSLVLLVYWFRYSCILLLRNHASPGPVPGDPRFRFNEIQEGLRGGEELDSLHQSLDRDYQVLTYLLQHAAGIKLESFEDRLLVLDYRVMHYWYRLTRIAAPARARRALAEMASVAGALAGRISERAGIQNEA